MISNDVRDFVEIFAHPVSAVDLHSTYYKRCHMPAFPSLETNLSTKLKRPTRFRQIHIVLLAHQRHPRCRHRGHGRTVEQPQQIPRGAVQQLTVQDLTVVPLCIGTKGFG